MALDLNGVPIEDLWAEIGRRIGQLQPPGIEIPAGEYPNWGRDRPDLVHGCQFCTCAGFWRDCRYWSHRPGNKYYEKERQTEPAKEDATHA